MSLEEATLSKRNHIYQDFRLINAQFNLSKNAMDLIFTIFTTLKKEDKELKVITFGVSQLEEKTGVKWHSVQLAKTIKEIQSKVVHIEVNENKWSSYNIFPTFHYDNGIISCRINEDIKPFLLNFSGRFVEADLRVVLALKSSYAKRIYLLLKEYRKFGKREFKLAELLGVLQAPKSFSSYGKLKEKVLTPALEQINKYSDISVKLEELKNGHRSVKELNFVIKNNFSKLSEFKEAIKFGFANKSLIKSGERSIACSEKGIFYYTDNNEQILEKKSVAKIWDVLYKDKERIMKHV